MDYPEELRYTREHEWVREEDGGRLRVGITDFAQDALGDVVYVDVPGAGTEISEGEPFGEVESTKSVSDVFAPVTGVVLESNSMLTDTPNLVNEDPYGAGWMILVEASDPSQVSNLMDAEAYRRFTVSDAEEEP